MKKILITGAMGGLGKHLTQFFLSKGYFVYGTTRFPNNGQNEKNLKLFYLDYCDRTSISEVAGYFAQTGEALDAIIHNAGITYLDPIEILDENEYRDIFEVNFFGPISLTKKLLPNLKKSKKSSLLFISSIVSIDCWPYLGAYTASKRAIESAAFEWAVLLKSWNINVSVIQPNPLPTDMDIKRSKNSAYSHYPELKDRVLRWESVEDTLKLVNSILESETPKFQYQTGKFSKETASKFLNEDAYQNSVENYQNQFIEMMQGIEN